MAGVFADTDAMNSFLDFLSEDLPPGMQSSNPQLDPSTLDAATAALGGSRRPKRARAATALMDADDSDLDEAEEPKGSGKKRKESAAVTKAHREKARREKINDRFLELAELVDPGKEPKTDKLSILQEAIRFVRQVQVENQQLKQLNKFLEEKAGQVEKERSQMMYQMYQAGGLLGPAGGMGGGGGLVPPGMMQPGPGMMPPGMVQPGGPVGLMMGLTQQQAAAQMMRAGSVGEASTSAAGGDAGGALQCQQDGGASISGAAGMQQVPGMGGMYMQPGMMQGGMMGNGALQAAAAAGMLGGGLMPPPHGLAAMQQQNGGAGTSGMGHQQQQQQLQQLQQQQQQQQLHQQQLQQLQQQQMQQLQQQQLPTIKSDLSVPASMPAPHWHGMLPGAVDSRQDSLLRPPAA